MKAVVYESYGGPEVLSIKDVDQPTPKPNEVLVKVSNVSINPYDWHYMRGTPYFIRLTSGLFSPNEKIMGNDVAGIVESVGSSVSGFKKGDAVFGSSKLRGLAEYVTIPEDRLFLKPENTSMAEACTWIIAAGTALVGVRKFGDIKAGQSVLINGASGGVGTFAVQMAKERGAVVSTVCSTKNLALMKTLGADHTIDYTQSQLEAWNAPYDAVIDVMGNLTVSDFKKLIKPGGRVVVIGFTGMGNMMNIMLRKKIGGAEVKVVQFDSADVLPDLAEMMQEGKVKPVMDKTFPIDRIQEAMTYLETMHTCGKVVIEVGA